MERLVVNGLVVLRHPVVGIVLPFVELDDQRLTHELAVLHLAEIGRPRVGVDFGQDLVDPGQGMQDGHLFLGQRHPGRIQHKTVLDPVEFVLVQETLLLHARHVEHVQFGHDLFHRLHLAVGDAGAFADVVLDVVGKLELLGRDQHDLDVLVAGQGLDQGMDGATEAQVAAETDRDPVDVSQFALDGQQVGQGLRRVAVAAVAGVDDGDGRHFGGIELRAFDVVTHRDEFGEAADHAHRVLYRLALAHGRTAGVGETEHVAAQLHHG